MNLDEIREKIKKNQHSCWLWFKFIDEAINEETQYSCNTRFIITQTDELLLSVLFSRSGRCMYRLFIKELDTEIYQYCCNASSKGHINIYNFEYYFNLGIKELNLNSNSDLFEIIQNEEIIYRIRNGFYRIQYKFTGNCSMFVVVYFI